MFSPSVPSQQHTLRSTRRRPRSIGNIEDQPSSKRQRSAVTKQTFVPPEPKEILKQAQQLNSAPVREVLGPQKEIAVRAKKPRTGERAIKGDGSTILTTNDTYTVSKLVALPDRLRADTTVHQHGAIYADNGYGLVLTHSHAIVWPYAAHIPSPETFTFALPETSKHVSDPLPLGSLVSASASSSDPGLVVVIPKTGKVTYWESVSSAATMDLRLQRNGVDHTIGGMHSGEHVTHILNAESAGFILAFSSGRTAYMSVRDTQGRPFISVSFLRGGGFMAGGIFGSVRNMRNMMSSASQGDIAAVRASRPERIGERSIVIATTKGRLQSWNIQRGGNASMGADLEGRELLVMAIKEQTPNLSGLLLESFEILDFTYTPKSFEDSAEGSQVNQTARLLLLTSLKSNRKSYYFLIEAGLLQNELRIGTIRPIKSYTSPLSPTATSKPRLYLPNPALVAYIVFDRAVVVMSMAKEPESPDVQLRSEGRLLPRFFEDVVDFREDMNVEIVGSGMEEAQESFGVEDTKSRRYRAKYPSAILIVRGGGIIRIAATDPSKLTAVRSQEVSAKSKLEQAVFFGKKDHTLLNFAVRAETQFSSEQMGEAALELSSDILRSRTSHITSVPASVDQNLQTRSAALHDLAEYLRDNNIRLDRVTKWRLLWDAERVRAARLVWERYDSCVKEKPEGQKRGLLAEVVEYIHEDYKTEPVAEAGELDRVRHWFINDIWQLEVAIPWAYQVIKYTYQDGQKNHNSVMQILSEADDLVLAALQGAYDFRSTNLSLYGLGAEKLQNGILEKNYEGLPEFWTSTIYITENLRKQAELAGVLAKEYWRAPPQEGRPDERTVQKVRYEYSVLIDLAIRTNTERIRWDLAQSSPDLQMEAEKITSARDETQADQIILLAQDLELPDEALELAEKHEILNTLAYVLQSELSNAKISLGPHSRLTNEATIDWEERLSALREKVNRCFGKFGMRWAAALYEFEINGGSINELLDGWPEHQKYLTQFLRERPEYAKISWINDITREKDFSQSCETLLDLALKREQDKWGKKIELSMGKLALLVDQNSGNAASSSYEITDIDTQLGLIKIQDQIHEVVLPSVNAAIDENAELQLALEIHGGKALKNQPTLLSLLETSMNQLLLHEAMKVESIVDLLTLMSNTPKNGDYDYFRDQQFSLALQAIRGVSNMDEQFILQKIIWKRCVLRDDWAIINNTNQKYDDQVTEQVASTALYAAFRACFKTKLFSKESNIVAMKPSDLLGAGIDQLPRHLAGLDASQKERFIKDMELEEDSLKQFIERSRLDFWFESTLEIAKQHFEMDLAEETAEGATSLEATERLEDIEKSIREKSQKDAQLRLHAQKPQNLRKKQNGNAGKFRSSIKHY